MIKGVKYLVACFDAELLKSRKTFAFWLALISPVLISVIIFLVYMFGRQLPFMGNTGDPWPGFIDQNFKSVATFLLPFFVVLVTTLIVYIDHKNNTWKLMHTLPVPKWSIFYSKLFYIAFLIFLTHLFFLIIILANGALLGLLKPELGFLDNSPAFIYLIAKTINSFLVTLGIVTIQYWLSIRVKNLFIPLGIGLIMIVAGNILILAFIQEIIYIPYSYPSINSWGIIGDRSIRQYFLINEVALYSLIYFVFVSFLFYLDVRRINVK